MMPNSDPRDRFVCLYLTLMIILFLAYFFVPTLELITILPLNTLHIHISNFVLTPFSDALVTSITTNVKHRVRTTGSIRVRTVSKILDILVFFHLVCKNKGTSMACSKTVILG